MYEVDSEVTWADKKWFIGNYANKWDLSMQTMDQLETATREY